MTSQLMSCEALSLQRKLRAPCGNRTHYLFLTKEVLYQ